MHLVDMHLCKTTLKTQMECGPPKAGKQNLKKTERHTVQKHQIIQALKSPCGSEAAVARAVGCSEALADLPALLLRVLVFAVGL